ncbi:nuclear transport factor 2 family protein [Flavivirga abyssicola]|uniref:nuclear transport factor 2 family protein n=1 Tax=Flavivirga abyssicola TaxID=3063533 RepID=UPI0026DEC0DF|nr:nuclear transport factor 2 family protein [Flavivirga sp. MEBiC07777]WVK12158.1 nuclear transport factor 2 family protein [Flavivirga sp. MEBiC07777]
MKYSILIIMIISLFSSTTGFSQENNIEKIKTTIIAFVKAGDQNDHETLATYLDDDYRLIINRLFGASTVNIMSKSVYLEKIKSKELGGDNRTLTIHEILLNGTTAMAKVTLKGKKMTFVSLITLLMDESRNWKLINDVPFIIKED